MNLKRGGRYRMTHPRLKQLPVAGPAPADTRSGIVNLTADTQFPVISLDTHLRKYKELEDRSSSV
jgi:hypothetical protein